MTPTQISDLLDQLTTRLGPTGAHVFELAVRQQYINAGINLGWALLLVIVAIAFVCMAVHFARRYLGAPPNKRDGSYIEAAILFIVCAAIALGFALAAVTTALPILLNPEYAALQDLLRAVSH